MNGTEKRLLILGGTTSSILVVETARRMGVYTVVTDMNVQAPAKKHADKAYDIDTSKIEDVVRLVSEERIDGVFAAYDDQNTSFAARVCQIVGLPFYATEEQINITKSKSSFKSLCRQYAVPTVEEYAEGQVEFPCVVKPDDAYSAKGVTICRHPTELGKAIDFALGFSKSGRFLIERYMDPASCECVNIEYLIRNGKISLSALGDKYVLLQGNHAPITAAVLYPSKWLPEFVGAEVDINIMEMLKGIGARNGMVYIEAFYDTSGFHCYEMGYRLGGGQSSVILKAENGVDYVEMLIRYALGEGMCEGEQFEIVSPKMSRAYAGMSLHLTTGLISHIDMSALSDPSVIRTTTFRQVGDCVQETQMGTLGQLFARVHVVASTRMDLVSNMHSILVSTSVQDVSGNEMIVPFDLRRIRI